MERKLSLQRAFRTRYAVNNSISQKGNTADEHPPPSQPLQSHKSIAFNSHITSEGEREKVEQREEEVEQGEGERVGER